MIVTHTNKKAMIGLVKNLNKDGLIESVCIDSDDLYTILNKCKRGKLMIGIWEFEDKNGEPSKF